MVFDISQPPLIMVNQQGTIEDIISSTRTNVMSAINMDSNIRPKVPLKTPAPTYLFDINVDSDLFPESLKIIFHSTVAKLIYVSTRTRQDLLTTISFLSKRVSNPSQEDWRKLQRPLDYLDNTKSQTRHDYPYDNTYVHRCIICCSLRLQVSHWYMYHYGNRLLLR